MFVKMGRHSEGVSLQVNTILQTSCFIDIDNDEYKKSAARDKLKAESTLTNSHDLNGNVHITQSKTLEKYKGIYTDLCHFARSNGLGNDIRAYDGNVIKSYLENKLADGRGYNTMRGYCSALNKLDNILNACDGGTRDYAPAIQEYKQVIADLPRTDTAVRRFNNPQNVIDHITDARVQLAAEIEFKTGLRCNDVSYFRINDNNTLYIKSKAGFRVPEYKIPQNLMSKIKEFANCNNTCRLTTYSHYSYELKKACEATGERFTGTHALRHSYAYESYNSHIADGLTVKEAKAEVSHELFHDRLDIVEKYLR